MGVQFVPVECLRLKDAKTFLPSEIIAKEKLACCFVCGEEVLITRHIEDSMLELSRELQMPVEGIALCPDCWGEVVSYCRDNYLDKKIEIQTVKVTDPDAREILRKIIASN